MNRLLLAPLLALATVAFAQNPATPAAPPAAPQFKPIVESIDLKDGDTLVFLGDSITHQCLYTQYVEDYFYTRFPKLRIKFHNAGVGGDRASDAIRRFDEDVAAYKPKYVTILLGMNDGSYRDFDKAVFDTYQAGMTTVLDKIAELGATAVPMTPTMFDSRAKRLKKDEQEPRNTYYNGVLALYGAWLREQAEVRGLGFVDMWSPLNNLTLQQRKTAPDFTLIKDGVHPDAPGQAIMAAAIIEHMVKKTPVSRINIGEKNGKIAATGFRGKVSDFQQDGDAVSFTFTAQSLPWVLPPEAAEGVALAKLGQRFSSERLIARDLKTGSYELKIDGTPVGTFTSGQLATGIELQGNDKTPQYQQALKVAMLNKQRNETAYHPLRDQYAQLKGKRRDITKAEQANDPQLDAKKAAFTEWETGMKAKVTELLAKAKTIEDEIYAANQPQPRKYELAPVK
jgi:lysophospholipase L1-like esterase